MAGSSVGRTLVMARRVDSPPMAPPIRRRANDYPDFLETMYAILDGMEGHEVAGFEGDETTVEQLTASAPHLLIVDLRIAGDDIKGWDILTLARADPALRDVPLIVCSADVVTLRARADEFRRIGNIYPLEKPFGVDDVTTLVEMALNGRGAKPQRNEPTVRGEKTADSRAS